MRTGLAISRCSPTASRTGSARAALLYRVPGILRIVPRGSDTGCRFSRRLWQSRRTLGWKVSPRVSGDLYRAKGGVFRSRRCAHHTLGREYGASLQSLHPRTAARDKAGVVGAVFSPHTWCSACFGVKGPLPVPVPCQCHSVAGQARSACRNASATWPL